MVAQTAAGAYKSARIALKNALGQSTTEAELNAALDTYDLAIAAANINLVKAATIAPLDVTVQHEGPQTGYTAEGVGKLS